MEQISRDWREGASLCVRYGDKRGPPLPCGQGRKVFLTTSFSRQVSLLSSLPSLPPPLFPLSSPWVPSFGGFAYDLPFVPEYARKNNISLRVLSDYEERRKQLNARAGWSGVW